MSIKNLFSGIVSVAGNGEMGEISYEINGMPATMLNYGDVMIKIANNGGCIAMKRVRNPRKVRDLITKIRGI